MFTNPVPGSYLTSPFGRRPHPKFGYMHGHQGVDLGKQPNNNVEILAAADGEVIRVGTIGTYGNVVILKHIINGKRYDTLYAHLKDKSTRVKKGQKVKRGQVLGIMGMTGGSSTGIHLHFEIHEGPWATGQPNAVDPAKYIKFYTRSELQKMEQRLKALEALTASQQNEIAELKNLVIAVVDNAAVYTSKDPVSDYAKDAIDFAVKNGILKGDQIGNLNPHGALKRQDMTIMLQRFAESLNKTKCDW